MNINETLNLETLVENTNQLLKQMETMTELLQRLIEETNMIYRRM